MKIAQSAKTERDGVQIVGEQFVRAGYIFREQTVSDYGIDAHIELVDGDNVTGKLIAVQIKSGSSWLKEKSKEAFIFRGDKEHLKYWLEHSLPVLIVLCDVKNRQCFWQAITAANVVHTNKAWKINIPQYQRINPGMDVDLKRLVNKLPVHKNYTIGSTDDVSHGAAKRYSLKLILNKEHTQAEIIDLIKNATSEAINTEYHRCEITRSHWRDHPAHVVWLMIYPSAEDEKNSNYICQSEWFSASLPKDSMPSSNGGEDIGANIRVCWNEGYLVASRYNAKHIITKDNFIVQVRKLAELTKPLVKTATEELARLQSNEISFDNFSMILTGKYAEINDIYNGGIELGLSPFECKDSSIKFQSLIAHAHNVYLPFGGMGKGFELSQTIFNINSQAKYYYEALAGFEFELNKVL